MPSVCHYIVSGLRQGQETLRAVDRASRSTASRTSASAILRTRVNVWACLTRLDYFASHGQYPPRYQPANIHETLARSWAEGTPYSVLWTVAPRMPDVWPSRRLDWLLARRHARALLTKRRTELTPQSYRAWLARAPHSTFLPERGAGSSENRRHALRTLYSVLSRYDVPGSNVR